MFAAAALGATLLLGTAPATADTLLVDRSRQPAGLTVPARGMTMAQVEADFGAPSQRLEPRGGQKRQWPTIHRWVYPAFTVYFERNRVVDTVANRATASEIGPKPAIR
ncbi:hypothetical protein MNO14_10690 [Luteimonas sp. S4-F44]|uniref:hypothetical protein n=1 Tax=Luteimonas sp. S4-F44 TaxID=2925842 RepID=UPI001F535BBB|nr:hypothetical protein [Luteimonas sp. S4-F44]UNK44151.1 hypothetical protein MNO14_10690 [Luteimonas sp. S4-F44]